MKAYAVLFAPEFRLQATIRHTPGLLRQPVALLEIRGGKARISEFNGCARKHRIESGLTSTQAMARCAHLHLLSGNPGHERSAQEALLQTAETLSPFLEATAPGIITVELPSERSVAEEELIRRCVRPLLAIGLEIYVGVAATPSLALLAAREGNSVRMVGSAENFLAPLPVEALDPPAELLSILHSWGIHTLGQWTALPLAQVCERLGPETVRLWQEAVGGRTRPLRLVKPREFFAEQADLEHPVEMLEPLCFLLRRFLEQIVTRLAQVYLVAGRLRLLLRFENGPPYRRIFNIPQPTRDVDLLFRMLQTHLENFTAESPIIALELAAQPVRPVAGQSDLLEKSLRDPHRFAETLARLQALLGTDRVGSPEVEPSHHPDAFHLHAFEAEAVAPRDDKELLLGAPWLRFRPAIPARVTWADIRPTYLDSSQGSGPITEARGPWLLEGQWWEPKRWVREEWDVATEQGLYRLVRREEGWFLDGIYA